MATPPKPTLPTPMRGNPESPVIDHYERPIDAKAQEELAVLLRNRLEPGHDMAFDAKASDWQKWLDIAADVLAMLGKHLNKP
jgi:hypothetical protein